MLGEMAEQGARHDMTQLVNMLTVFSAFHLLGLFGLESGKWSIGSALCIVARHC